MESSKAQQQMRPLFTRNRRQQPDALPVHTAKARWGVRPDENGRYGRSPDWHVLTIQPDPADRQYPYWIEGWRPDSSAEGEAAIPFFWKVPDLNDARYDLSEAVVIPPTSQNQ